MKVGVLGINHKSADLSLREKLARIGQKRFGSENCFYGLFSYILLSTCNRTEIYFHADDLAEAHTDLLQILRLEMEGEFEHRIYSYFGEECFFHLAQVTSGMDSAILGETEIQGQVKKAYESAVQYRLIAKELHFLFQKSLKVGKEIRTKAGLNYGLPSLDEAIFQAGEGFLDNFFAAKILFVGISEINYKIFKRFKQKGITNVTFCNRTKEKGDCLKEEEKISLLDWDQLHEWANYDVSIFATKSPNYLLSRKNVQKSLSSKKLVIDLSVPRNIDPSIGKIPGISLLNVDQLNCLLDKKRKEKAVQIAKIERQVIAKAVEKQIEIFRLKEVFRENSLLCVS